MNKLVSVIIPAYNEEKLIADCLRSLNKQTYRPLEVIVVDDGSTDNTIQIVKNFKCKFLGQNHQGPGPARNLGASNAHGEILVFVDADMTFEKNFIKDLVKPILKGETIGTFSKNEIVANSDNTWSRCWNLNRNLPKDKMLPENYPNEAPVFRAILKSKFQQVGGFDNTGEYADDWSLSRKLGVKSTVVKGANYFHANPASLKEIFTQARWIGKNQFIAGSFLRKIRSLVIYSLPFSIIIASVKSILAANFAFIIFKLVYDFAIWISVVKLFLGESKAK